MIVVRTPKDKTFNYTECKELFEEYSDVLDVDDFDTVINTTHFFSFYEWNKAEFLGCIYFYQEDDKVFVTAVSTRGHADLNQECLKIALSYYNCDIYAEKVQKVARIPILKCGFNKINKDLYVYRRNK